MIEKEEIGLEGIQSSNYNFSIKIDNSFLQALLIKAADDGRPHCNSKFIKKIGLELSNKYLCNTIYGWTKYDKTIPFSKLMIITKLASISLKEVQENITFIGLNGKNMKIYPKFPIKLNKQLGSIIGHIYGDGSIDKKYLQVCFSNSEKELLKEFSNNIKEIFDINPRIWMQTTPIFGDTHWDKRLNSIDELKDGRNCGLFYPTILGIFLNTIFDNFAIGKDKKINLQILNTNKEFKKGLIRAFYDDESSVGTKSIRLFQDRQEFLETFRKLLLEFDISSGEVKRYKKRNKDRFYFDIFRKSNFLKFQKEIGFTSPLKAERLKKIVIITNHGNSK
ncbi:MAG: LAGLIDADG family homing endonuclease [Candidatus Pacearchaeota archaeon]